MTKEIPATTVKKKLKDVGGISMKESRSEVCGVVVRKDFDTMLRLSRILDQYDFKVKNCMWVDEGHKFYLEPA